MKRGRLACSPVRPVFTNGRWGVAVTRGLKALVWICVLGMFFVLMGGALVTKTGSGDGCGASWPLCDGELLPAWQAGPLIEYSHRIVSGIVGVAVLAFSIILWRNYGERREMKLLAGLAAAFLLIQAGLGAGVVLAPQPDWLLALHFGISLASFASVLLAAVLLYQMNGRGTGRRVPVSHRLRGWAWGSLAFVYVVVYSGAYVRHTNSHLACLDWPLCNGELIPTLSGPVGIQFAHRVGAFVAVLALLWLARLAYAERHTRPDVYRAAVASAVIVTVQALVGGAVVLTRLSLGVVMVHSALITILFGVLSYVGLQTLREPPRMRVGRRITFGPARIRS